MSNIANNRVLEIQTLLIDLNRTLKMSVEKAIRIGQLLSEQKTDMQHGEFLPWLESNFEMSERMAYRYMSLFKHNDKVAKMANLQEAYQQIEYIEKKEREDKQKHDEELIRQRIKTGEKPEGWDRHLEYEYKKRTDDEGFKKRLNEHTEKQRQEKEEKEKISHEKSDRAEQVINKFITDTSDKLAVKEKLKLNVRSDNINQEAIIEIIDEYLSGIIDVSRRIETAQNIIKYLRATVVNFQRKGA